jgi:uncharacterized protein YdaU (DUF1376 family)
MADAWSAFYWGDYSRKTSHLTLTEHGAYLLLMKHYYSTRKPLNTNVSRLYAICRAVEPTERAAVDYILSEFFVLQDSEDGCYHHPRIDEELAKASKISEIRRDAVAHRVDRQAYKPPTNNLQMNTQSQPQSQPQSQSSLARSALKKGSRISTDFVVTGAHREWAGINGLPPPDEHIEEFRDYWKSKAGGGGVKLDWDATFRNWLRRAAERRPHGKQSLIDAIKRSGESPL